MTEELLDNADVRSPFEEMRGERVPERVRGHTTPGQRLRTVSLHEGSDVAYPERPTLAVEEQRGRPLDGERRSTPVEILPDGLDREVRHRDVAFFRALAQHPDPSVVQVDPIECECTDLPRPQARPVQQLEDRPVSECHRPAHLVLRTGFRGLDES